MSGASRKRPRYLDPGQTGFVQYEILSRIWVEGTYRIKELTDEMVREVVEAFGAMYPQDSDSCFPQKIYRMYNQMRPVRIPQPVNASTTSVLFEYSEPVKRHAALFALQQQAARALDDANQLLADASMETSSPEFAERLAVLSNLHHEFEEWCVKYGSDVITACNTRNALRCVLERMNDAISSCTQKEQLELKPVSSNSLRASKVVSDSIHNRQVLFMRRASKLVDLHNEQANIRQREKKQNIGRDVCAEEMPIREEAPIINTTRVAPIVNAADSVRELELDISTTEKSLLALYEKKRKFGTSVMAPMHKRNAKFLGFFVLPDGKMKHISIGLDGETGDKSACQLLLAKHGYVPLGKGTRIKHYTSK